MVRAVAVAMAVGVVRAPERSPVAVSRVLVMVDPEDRVALEVLGGMDKLETAVHPMLRSVQAAPSKLWRPSCLRVTQASRERVQDDLANPVKRAPRRAAFPETASTRRSKTPCSCCLSLSPRTNLLSLMKRCR